MSPRLWLALLAATMATGCMSERPAQVFESPKPGSTPIIEDTPIPGYLLTYKQWQDWQTGSYKGSLPTPIPTPTEPTLHDIAEIGNGEFEVKVGRTEGYEHTKGNLYAKKDLWTIEVFGAFGDMSTCSNSQGYEAGNYPACPERDFTGSDFTTTMNQAIAYLRRLPPDVKHTPFPHST